MINKVILVGNLGGDPETRYTTNGTAVSNFNIATTKRYKDNNGEKQEKTEWHKIVVWGSSAEFCGNYLKKGHKVYIEGELQTRSYDKDGVKVYVTEVRVNIIQNLSAPIKQETNQADSPPF
jgi:single-strand DNA-binding protein